MTQLPVKSRSRSVLLAFLLVIGLACTVAGICMIAFAKSPLVIRSGFPVALWGVLLGSWALHGTRWSSTGVALSEPGGVVELRRSAEVEREDDASARREYELRLELMLRRQMESVLREQVSLLREDVAGLRGEVLEAVDGRLRLERIETTRIIGSDLAALQNEVRRLNVERDALPGAFVVRDSRPGRDRNVIESPPPGNGRSELWTPSSAQGAVTPAPAVPPSADPPLEAHPVEAPPPVQTPPPAPEPVAVRAPEPVTTTPHFESDLFAGLPRLSSFDADVVAPVGSARAAPTEQTDPPPDPAPVAKPTESAPAPKRAHHFAPTDATSRPDADRAEYVGRRRSS